MIDFRTAAKREVASVLRIASRAIDKELFAKPPRRPVTYSNGVTVNTHELFIRLHGNKRQRG